MKLLCKMFGHIPTPSLEGGNFYYISPPYHDGIGRAHRELYATCDRCKARYKVGKTIDPLEKYMLSQQEKANE